jgi:16S rRNA G966 N2-methylase RsmD
MREVLQTAVRLHLCRPPYALKELPQIPDLIFEKQLLTAEGIFVFEHGKDYDFSNHPHFLEHRSYGSVNFSLFRA